MRPAVHLHPDRLRAHSAAAAELAGVLQAALARRPPAAGAASDAGRALWEIDTAVRRAARELAELGAALAAVAAATESSDHDAARAMRRADGS
jgi:hypothetical protein